MNVDKLIEKWAKTGLLVNVSSSKISLLVNRLEIAAQKAARSQGTRL